MSKIFDVDFRTGSTIDKISKTKGTLTDVEFIKDSKGLSLSNNNTTTSVCNFGTLDALNVGTGDFTYVVMFKLKKFLSSATHIIGKRSGSYWSRLYLYNNKIYFELSVTSGGISISETIDESKDYFIIAERKDGVAKLYVNNVEIGSNTYTGIIDNSADLTLLKWSSESSSDINIYKAQIYNHALSTKERTKLFKEFVNSQPAVKPKRNFTYPKPTDLSNEADSKVGDELLYDGTFNITQDGWSKTSRATYISDNSFRVDGGAGGYIKTGLTIGQKYIVHITGTTSNDTFAIRNNATTTIYHKLPAGEFNESFTFTATTDNRIYVRSVTGGEIEITSFSVRELKGLIAAYNMIPQNGKLVDISGNGNNGTIYGALATKDGLKFDGVDDVISFNNNLNDISVNTDCSFCCRIKLNSLMASSQIVVNSLSSTDRIGIIVQGDKIAIQKYSGSYTGVGGNYNINKELDVVGINEDGNLKCYINGVEVNYDGISGDLGNSINRFTIGANVFKTGSFFDGEIYDVRVYNYALSEDEIKAYHNQFVKPALLEDFSGNGADGIVKTPRGWTKDTGEYKVEELALKQGELITNGGFDTDSDWNKSTGVTISNGIAELPSNSGSNVYIYQTSLWTNNTMRGHRIRIEYEIIENTLDKNLSFFGFSSVSIRDSLVVDSTVGKHSIEITVVGQSAGDSSFFIYHNANTGTIKLDNISMVEIPPLKGFESGTKYLENVTAGTTAIQSKQTYGEWEFDVYKGADTNYIDIAFIADRIGGLSATNGYNFRFRSNESIVVYKNIVGSNINLFDTTSSYINNNTWYKLKVVRLQSEGVFKDIPTLQTSDLVNGDYITFTSNGRYGFHAISDGVGTQDAGTVAEILFTGGAKYLIEFDLKLKSGTAPKLRLATSLSTGGITLLQQSVNGKNSLIFTNGLGDITGLINFMNQSTATDYEISGLTIRRIYPKDTFAVFIKGGNFGNEWTLVDTTGGSGTNPVTDSTYTTSEYFVLDLDREDKFANLKINNGVKQ